MSGSKERDLDFQFLDVHERAKYIINPSGTKEFDLANSDDCHITSRSQVTMVNQFCDHGKGKDYAVRVLN
jgi:hypothetical protein